MSFTLEPFAAALALPAVSDAGFFLFLSALFAVAVLYGAVGHGGASGYLAVMTLLSFPPATLRPTALVLNLFVSLVGTVCFFRSGSLRGRMLLPLVAGSIPAAAWGGTRVLSDAWFHGLLALALGFAALRLFWPLRDESVTRPVSRVTLAGLGAGIGVLSGLVGVGGGIFLTPILILFRWTDARTAAALSAPFIFVNSAAGLLGQMKGPVIFAPGLGFMVPAVLAGGCLGATWGSGRAKLPQLRAALAVVLIVACTKLVFV